MRPGARSRPLPAPVLAVAVAGLAIALVLVLAVSLALVTAPPATTPVASPLAASAPAGGTRVLAISVDGLNPVALRRLGVGRAPTLHRLVAEGRGTLNARTARELTQTLPNHTSMVTGRRIDSRRGGHGVDWNDHRRGTTVRRAAGRPVASVFTVVDRAGGSSAVFAGKEKFTLFRRSWPRAIDRFRFTEDDAALVRAAQRDLVNHDRALTFLHLRTPDTAGHADGFGSRTYLDAVARVDRLVGTLVATIERDDQLRQRTVVVLTSDHGGSGPSHLPRARLGNYRIPFLVWGASITGGDLYALNPQRRDPGRGRPTYGARRQPVRNGDLANVVTALLGLRPVPGSRLNPRQDLRVR
ncbi:alkaline phosphatase family protein [Nocardioides pantholopis]|uniref:alkaline phosphatase family protein n=1 Tax=Nocardioides pantholopis TaxID=2483798 RepID=UPI000FDA6564|nr:alkaline phosphatase family protein [Nocardioides pantholopis]